MRHTASCPNDARLTATGTGLYIYHEAFTCVGSDGHFAKQMLACSNEIRNMRWRKRGKNSNGKVRKLSQNRHRTQINIMLQWKFTKRENRTKQNISHEIIYSVGTSLQIFVNEELLLIISNEVTQEPISDFSKRKFKWRKILLVGK